ncbi:hypothetical protein [Salinicola avicenniae]|uniref:hypothetical protein n=1 Tax=Salinicola avicenniae TaxID=2916836 RepID=UPI002072EB5B|nr:MULTISPECIES: hypothetical protein [unclassified Salinicola]
MATTNPLRVVIEGVDRLTAPLRRINGRIQRMTGPVQQLRASFQSLTRASGLGRLSESVSGIGRSIGNVVGRARDLSMKLGAIGAAAGGMFGVLVSGYTRSAAETQIWADRLGVSADFIQRWQYAGEQFNVEKDALIDGMKELSLRADEYVVTGVGGAADAFQRLGISQDQLRQTSGDTEQMFDMVLGKLGEVRNVSARQRLFDEIFGGQGGEQMTELLTRPEAELQALFDQAREAGVRINENRLRGAVAFTRAMQGLGSSLEGARNALIGPMLPALRAMTEQLTAFVTGHREDISAFGEQIGEKLPAAFRRMGDWLKTLPDRFKRFMAFIQPITDRFGVLNTALAAIGLVVFGPLLAALASLTQAFVVLGVTLLTTPVGWFLAAIALIGAAVYLIYRNWDAISGWFADKFQAVREAFSNGLIDGVLTLLREFNPVILVIEALDAIVEYFTGFSLLDAGKNMIDSLWSGIRSKFDDLTGWFRGAVDRLRDMVPDWMTGMFSDDETRTNAGTLRRNQRTAQRQEGREDEPPSRDIDSSDPDRERPEPARAVDPQATGRALAGNDSLASTARAFSPAGQQASASVNVRFENLPQGTRVDQTANSGVDLGMDMGYSMGG